MNNDIPAAQSSGCLRGSRDHAAGVTANRLHGCEQVKAVGKGRAVIASLLANPRHHILNVVGL